MSTLHIERVDLATLVEVIRARGEAAFVGAVVGRTNMRDDVAAHLGCSLLETEQLVDTMVARGLVRLERQPDGREVWRPSAR